MASRASRKNYKKKPPRSPQRLVLPFIPNKTLDTFLLGLYYLAMGGKENLPTPPGVWWIPLPVSLTKEFWGDRRPVSQPSKTFFRENGRKGVLEEVTDGSTAAEELLQGETVVATICRMVTESGQLVCQVALNPVFAKNKDIQAHLQNCGGSRIE